MNWRTLLSLIIQRLFTDLWINSCLLYTSQPAVDIENKRTYITSQNHGYAVVSNSLRDGSHMSYVNANDFTCEGVEYDYMPAFSVQFHPEASAGPLDTSFLFDKFISVIEKNRKR